MKQRFTYIILFLLISIYNIEAQIILGNDEYLYPQGSTTKIKFKSGTSIYLNQEGKVIKGYLFYDEYLKVGNSSVKFKSGSLIKFYSNGSVQQGYIFYDEYLKLAGTSNSLKFKANQLTCFDHEGKVIQGNLAYDEYLYVQGLNSSLKFKSGNLVTFNGEGKVIGNANLWEDNLKKQQICNTSNYAELHFNGKVFKGYIINDVFYSDDKEMLLK